MYYEMEFEICPKCGKESITEIFLNFVQCNNCGQGYYKEIKWKLYMNRRRTSAGYMKINIEHEIKIEFANGVVVELREKDKDSIRENIKEGFKGGVLYNHKEDKHIGCWEMI